MTLLLRNMQYNRFQYRAINKDEKHKPMARTVREAQAQHNDTTQETDYRFQHCAINKDESDKPMSRTGREAQAQHNDTIQETIAFYAQ